MDPCAHITSQIGLDMGSVEAKLVLLCSHQPGADLAGRFERVRPFGSGWLLAGRTPVRGNPEQAALTLLELVRSWPEPLYILITGSHGRILGSRLQAPLINDFKAIGRGVAALLPQVKTILEIGGDHSRYLRIRLNNGQPEPTIVDYERNGDCAAGTGSFIDQQAQRLRYHIDEIGPLVLSADIAANIAGRCSVFAKSDMVHAQQRGYSPAAIFKGLCEAVVRNYKGAILRGKTIEPPVAFVGGVAANAGVVQAMRELLHLQEDELMVPPEHAFIAALGCASLAGAVPYDSEKLGNTTHFSLKGEQSYRPEKLTSDLVDFAQPPARPQPSTGRLDAYLGIDVGSVSTNLVLLDEQGWVLDEIYTRTEGRPVEVVQRELAVWKEKWGDRVRVLGVGTTGSGRELAGELVGADTINDEITAQKPAPRSSRNRRGGGFHYERGLRRRHRLLSRRTGGQAGHLDHRRVR